MKYMSVLESIFSRIESELKEISANYGFDYGPEFEIAICNFLRKILPDKYGICRGFAVDENGQKAGDDIFIYDKINFPSLRFLEYEDLSRKHDLPIEAIYAYIECKHTLSINGDGGQSLTKAISQCEEVKKLVLSRKPRLHSEAIEGVTFPGDFNRPDGYPDILNPVYTMIFSNNVKINEADRNPYLEQNFPENLLKNEIKLSKFSPDSIIMGKHFLFLPTILKKDNTEGYRTPFYLHGRSTLTLRNIPDYSQTASLVLLFEAMEWIRLKKINWHEIFASNFLMPNKNEDK